MVVFTCSACGDSVKKGQVEKHVNICRNCQCLSCMDCGKDFWGDDYKSHVKCLSEDQKYGGKGYEAKSNKGDVKQQEWIQKIHEVIKKPNISPKLRNILEQMLSYDNIPRKKGKFQNWMVNNMNIGNCALQDQVWDIFSEVTSNRCAEDENEETSNCNNEERKKKRKHEKTKPSHLEINGNGHYKEEKQTNTKKQKRKHAEEEPNTVTKRMKYTKSSVVTENEESGDAAMETEESGDADKGKFNWKGTIKAVLKQAPNHEISIKKLRKKVLAQFHAVVGEHHKSQEDLLVIFNKKVNNNPKFKVLKDRVKLMK